jgi:hypothetical protein
MEPRIDVDNNHVVWNVFNLVNDTVRSLQPPLTDPRVILHTPQRIISIARQFNEPLVCERTRSAGVSTGSRDVSGWTVLDW